MPPRRRFAYLTPESEGGSTVCRSLLIPDTFVHIVSGAIATLTEPWAYEKITPTALEPERCAEIMSEVLEQYLNSTCAVAAPPYWSEPVDEDVNDTSDADELYPWYEQVSDWIIEGFLASTFTPNAAVIYQTTLPRIRIALRQHDLGAAFRILINNVQVESGTTYALNEGVWGKNFDLTAPSVIRIENAEPAGFSALQAAPRLDVIRRHIKAPTLDEVYNTAPTFAQLASDYYGAFGVELMAPFDIRLNGTCVIEKTTDGTTWVEVADLSECVGIEGPQGPQGIQGPQGPQGPAGADGEDSWAAQPDPEPQGQDNDASYCGMADEIVNHIDDLFDDIIAGVEGSFGIGVIAATITSLMYAPLVATVASIVGDFIGYGVVGFRAAITTAVLEDVRCQLYCLVRDAGWYAGIMDDWYDSIIANSGANVALQYWAKIISSQDEAGWRARAAIGAFAPSAACVSCDCPSDDDPPGCEDFTVEFDAGVPTWVLMGSGHGVNLYPAPTYNASVGRTAAGCMQSSLSATGTEHAVDLLIDLGETCVLNYVSFWTRTTSYAGGNSFPYYIVAYTAAGVQLDAYGGPTYVSTNWIKREKSYGTPGLANVRYIRVNAVTATALGPCYIDDISIQVG